MKNSAVEWLVEQIIKEKGLLHLDLETAKEMEKQEKHAEYMRGWKDGLSCKSIKTKIR
jgi:hypothetical protein